jgi:hypothetical protein
VPPFHCEGFDTKNLEKVVPHGSLMFSICISTSTNGEPQKLHLMSVQNRGLVIAPIIIPSWIGALGPTRQSSVCVGSYGDQFLLIGGRCGNGILFDPYDNAIELVHALSFVAVAVPFGCP